MLSFFLIFSLVVIDLCLVSVEIWWMQHRQTTSLICDGTHQNVKFRMKSSFWYCVLSDWTNIPETRQRILAILWLSGTIWCGIMFLSFPAVGDFESGVLKYSEGIGFLYLNSSPFCVSFCRVKRPWWYRFEFVMGLLIIHKLRASNCFVCVAVWKTTNSIPKKTRIYFDWIFFWSWENQTKNKRKSHENKIPPPKKTKENKTETNQSSSLRLIRSFYGRSSRYWIIYS